MTLLDLENRFARIAGQERRHPDQEFGLMACEQALAAARIGNYGVGAILVSPTGQVIERGQNQAFYPIFRSDLHAEMVVMNAFEQSFPKVDSMRGYILICSLEPCPMCVFRLLISGVQTVKFLARDELGGMVAHMQHLPAAGKHLAKRQEFMLADVSEELRQFASDIFLLNLDRLRQKLSSR
jgi:tRNA(Arg) A34 adenosine deaminase TadA